MAALAIESHSTFSVPVGETTILSVCSKNGGLSKKGLLLALA